MRSIRRGPLAILQKRASRQKRREAASAQSHSAPLRSKPHAAAASSTDAEGDWKALLAAEAERILEAGEPQVWETLAHEFERTLIRTAMSATRGRRIEAAERLGLGATHLPARLQSLASPMNWQAVCRQCERRIKSSPWTMAQRNAYAP